MRAMIFGGMVFIYWTGFYALLQIFKDERMIFAAFAATLIISMVTAAMFLVRPKEKRDGR